MLGLALGTVLPPRKVKMPPRPVCFAWVSVFILGLPAADGSDAVRQPRSDIGFWIGTDANQVLSRQALEFIAPHATVFILRGQEFGPTPADDYASIMRRMKEVKPDVSRLVYASANALLTTTHRIEGSVLHGYENLGPLLLHTSQGAIFRRGATLYGDPTQSGYREWISERLLEAVDRFGVDGVALDLAHRAPHFLGERYRQDFPAAYADYGRGMDLTFTEIKRVLNRRRLVYNGLWTSVRNLAVADQRKLLAFADCAAVEYFGLDPLRQKETGSTFANDILPYLEIIRDTPEKQFLLFARGPWAYSDYAQDYRWQRYLYACHLLVAGPNVSFKYLSSFQTPSHSGRTGGLAVFADSDLDMGSPGAPFERAGALYLRRFSRGLVLVAPHDGPGGAFALPRLMYDPEGKSHAGSLTVHSGEGMLLLFEPAPPPAPVRQDFEHASDGIQELKWAEIRRDPDGNRFLALEPTPPKRTYEHDLILDWVRTPNPASRLRLRVRTTDEHAHLLLAAEIDDPRKAHVTASIEFGGSAKQAAGPQMKPSLFFRIELPGGENEGATSPLLLAPGELRPDGKWHDVTIEFPRNPQDYLFRRWDFLRPIGRIDIDDIRIE